LLSAAAILRDRGVPFRLSIVGAGPTLQFLRQRRDSLELQDCVELPGFIPHAQLMESLKSVDVFVLPSFAEGVPVVLMEAMSFGVPCVSTYVNGTPELIENEVSGLLVTPSDATALADALQRVIEDEALRERLSVAGREAVAQRFDLAVNVARLSSILEKRLDLGPA
jgi:glycosyltransferase involved in cell wall biosynthesis